MQNYLSIGTTCQNNSQSHVSTSQHWRNEILSIINCWLHYLQYNRHPDSLPLLSKHIPSTDGKINTGTHAALNNFSIFLGEHFDPRMHVYSKNNKIMVFFIGNPQIGPTSRFPPRLQVGFSKVHKALKWCKVARLTSVQGKNVLVSFLFLWWNIMSKATYKRRSLTELMFTED